MYIFKYCSKLIFTEKVYWHWLYKYGLSPKCVLEWLFKCPSFVKAFGHLSQGYGFHLCVSSNDSSKCHIMKKPLNIDCNDMVSQLCAFSNDSSNCILQNAFGHLIYSDMFFQPCVFSNVFSNCYLLRQLLDNNCREIIFTCVCSQMFFQTAIYRESI